MYRPSVIDRPQNPNLMMILVLYRSCWKWYHDKRFGRMCPRGLLRTPDWTWLPHHGRFHASYRWANSKEYGINMIIPECKNAQLVQSATFQISSVYTIFFNLGDTVFILASHWSKIFLRRLILTGYSPMGSGLFLSLGANAHSIFLKNQ